MRQHAPETAERRGHDEEATADQINLDLKTLLKLVRIKRREQTLISFEERALLIARPESWQGETEPDFEPKLLNQGRRTQIEFGGLINQSTKVSGADHDRPP